MLKNKEVLQLFETLSKVDQKSNDLSMIVRLKNKNNFRNLHQASQDIVDTRNAIYEKYGKLETENGKQIYRFVYDDVDNTALVHGELKKLEEESSEIELKKIPLSESDILGLKANTYELNILEEIFEYNCEI